MNSRSTQLGSGGHHFGKGQRRDAVGAAKVSVGGAKAAVGAVLVLALSLLFASSALGAAFPDVPDDHPYAVAIQDLSSRQIILGYTDGRFAPTDPVTRQQFAKMIVLVGGYPVSESDICPFTDVSIGGPDTLYPDNYVAVCAARGITTGVGDTAFDPYSNITRHQVTAMAVRVADDLQPGLLQPPAPEYVGAWQDDPTHGADARRAESNGLLSGLDPAALDPAGPMTRGEVAQLLHNLLDKLSRRSAPAEPATAARNAEVLGELPFADTQDFEDAARGFIATLPDVTFRTTTGKLVWTLKGFEFLDQAEAPPTVNPSLWRHARLNMNNGLFLVTDGVYQIRGFDMANMTIMEGETGIIIVDPLASAESSKAGLELYYQHRGVKPVKAVIYTHSHHDHYAGVKGVITEADVKAGNVEVLAPEGFLEAVISENVSAGTAMTRRASYMYGMFLPVGERGLVDVGLGKMNSMGTSGLIAPTDTITHTGESRTIDGVEMVFQIASGTEAPSEMTLYLPESRVLNSAEIACPLLHNVLTLRGAQVRDPKKWAECLNELIALYGDKTDVLIAQHNWPRWGQEDAVRLLADQRDLYKFIHDQTLHLMNQGYTSTEIAEMMELPDSLAHQWYARGYYGTLSHDVKAVYQRYLGWFDGNPANLNPLPPEESAVKYVEYMGGADAVMAKAREDFKNGEYRWVAQVMNQVVFADPDNAEARYLQAAALEQLGYQAESAPWRNFYLTGAQELRYGLPDAPGGSGSATADTVRAMTIPLFFDFWGVRLNAARSAGKHMVINWTFTDLDEPNYALNLSNCALTYRTGWLDPQADAGFTLKRATLDAVILGQTTLQAEVAAGNITVTGNAQRLGELMAMLDTFDPVWPIVTP